jgi:hypothetical protein
LREDGSAEASRVIRPRQQMRSRRWSTLCRNALDERSVARSSRIPPQEAVLGFSWSRIRLHAKLDARRGVRVAEKRCPVFHRRHWGARHLPGLTTGLVSFLQCPKISAGGASAEFSIRSLSKTAKRSSKDSISTPRSCRACLAVFYRVITRNLFRQPPRLAVAVTRGVYKSKNSHFGPRNPKFN